MTFFSSRYIKNPQYSVEDMPEQTNLNMQVKSNKADFSKTLHTK